MSNMNNTSFDTLLIELSTTRLDYEILRSAGDLFADRAVAQTRLHDLRSQIARARVLHHLA